MPTEVSPDQIFSKPDHEQWAESLIGDINRLNGICADAMIVAENQTESALDVYPQLIKRARNRGSANNAREMEQSLRDVEVRSASETDVSVLLTANSYESYDRLRPMIFELMSKYGAERNGEDDRFGDKTLPLEPSGEPYSSEIVFCL